MMPPPAQLVAFTFNFRLCAVVSTDAAPTEDPGPPKENRRPRSPAAPQN